MPVQASRRTWILGLVTSVICFAIGFYYLMLSDSEWFQALGDSIPKTDQPKTILDLSTVRIGTAEQTVKDAVLTFVFDEREIPGGVHQYLSRTKDKYGGQYIVQFIDGICFRVDVNYDPPINEDQGGKTLNKILPKVPVNIHTPVLYPVENSSQMATYYSFQPNLSGRFVYVGRDLKKVSSVSAWVFSQDGKLIPEIKPTELDVPFSQTPPPSNLLNEVKHKD